MSKIKPIFIGERGLQLFLGPLEVACMRAIWANHTTTTAAWHYVRQHYSTVKTAEIAYTSVSTTIYRLWEQNYVTRVGDRTRGFQYTPTHATETAFVLAHIHATVRALLENYPRETGQTMIEALRANVANAKRVEQ
jgi:predicted transcriptional regulator